MTVALILAGIGTNEMKITNLTIQELNLPFKQAFSHASATRTTTEAVLVTAESKNGITGYGEGCPRSYVTGESTETAVRFFDSIRDAITEIQSLSDLKTWTDTHREEINKNPAAWCATELALLDVLAKEAGESMESLLSLPELSDTFQYTAVLGSSGLDAYKKQLKQYIHVGFQDFKIKVSDNVEEDQQKIEALQALGTDIRVRLDANNLWQDAKQVISYIEALDYPFFAIEEPLKANDYDGCYAIYDALSIPIILDESFLRLEQFEHLNSNSKSWIINLRISKMGGILRSIAIAEKAKEIGVPIIIGAQVGETSILTRAALTVTNTCRNNLLAQEGAFGTHLLEKDITETPIMFGKGGKLDAASIKPLSVSLTSAQ